ncbi:spermidine synthase [Pseudonocardia sp. GCM10023141]|uniref:spermidine synthase n=1 Tax=Pseudonocardia sp. GCM10023141 TaxID=3252653 RepID=UPI003622A70A
MTDPDDHPVEVERCAGLCGELILSKRGAHHEIVANGTFLMDTRNGASERLLITAAAERMPPPGRMLIGGLGVGLSLAAALADPRVGEVHVVEREPAVIRWNLGPLAAVHGDAVRDPRTVVHEADIVDWLAGAETASVDAICLDVDNGPDWLVTPGNGQLYTDDGIATAARVLAPGGVLALWSAARADAFAARLRTRFDHVTTLEIPVPRGEPDVVVLGRLTGVAAPVRRRGSG